MFTTLFVLYLFIISCFSSLTHLVSLQTNHSDFNTTQTASISSTETYHNLCQNFTECDQCLNAIHTNNIHCSWIQHSNDPNNTFQCIEANQCIDNEDIECCSSLTCCNCLSQPNCIKCGSQGLNASCLWDHSHNQCFSPNHTCSENEKCLYNPSLLQCEYSRNGACSFYFTTTSFWTLGYCGMLIFFICLPCCLYHKCGIDWDSEFSLTSIYNQNINNNNNYADQLQPHNDGYVFKGGAHITGRCMYGSFLFIGFLFACIAIFGTILSISCLDEQI